MLETSPEGMTIAIRCWFGFSCAYTSRAMAASNAPIVNSRRLNGTPYASGNPALRRPSSNRARSSGEAILTAAFFFHLAIVNPG